MPRAGIERRSGAGEPSRALAGRRPPVRLGLAALGLLVSLARPATAQNPDGFLQTPLWACLLPLDGTDCTGGGDHALEDDWVLPHSLASESPVLGTIWRDIDFGDAARSRAWLGTGEPRFVSIPQAPESNRVDFGGYLDGRGLPSAFVLGIAVTYVENATGLPLPVRICTASDDSIQVWVNAVQVVRRSVCRALDPTCSELTPAVLAPGVNRLTVAVSQGYGEFSFRLGIARPDGSLYTESDPEIVCLGASDSTGVVGSPPTVRRSWDGDAAVCPAPRHEVTLTAEGGLDPAATYEVCEEVRGEVGVGDIRAASPGAETRALRDERPRIGEFHHAVVGMPCRLQNATDHDGRAYRTVATTDGDIGIDGDRFAYAFQRVRGDFDLSVEILSRDLPGAGGDELGIMARQTLDDDSRFGLVMDVGPGDAVPAGYRQRRIHGNAMTVGDPATTEGATDPNDPELSLLHPRFLRLTRLGSLLTAWVSGTAGLDGSDPRDDGQWYWLYDDDWSGAPEELYLGFALSTSACETAEVAWRPIVLDATEVELPATGVGICWTRTGRELEAKPLAYEVTAPPGTLLDVTGRAGGSVIEGPRILAFQADRTGPIGVFEASHDIGDGGPCTPGSLVHDAKVAADPLDDEYALTASGVDIWQAGDQFRFAHRAVTGDFTLVARVDGVDGPFPGGRWGKLGLMARWDCRPNSAYFFVHDCAGSDMACDVDAPRVAARPLGGVDGGNREPNAVWWQDVFGSQPMSGACQPIAEDPRANDLRGDRRNLAPWLRLVRRGNTFYGYGSDDGLDWVTLGSWSWLDPPATVLAGIAATSHSDCSPIRVEFSHVAFGTPDPIERSVSGLDSAAWAEVHRSDFSQDEDDPLAAECPDGWVCNGWGAGDFRPVAFLGRLRMGELATSPLGAGAWTTTTAFLADPVDIREPWLFEFDVRFRFDEAAGGSAAPGDGLTFCLLGTRTGTEHLDLRQGDEGSGLGYERINVSRDEPTYRTRLGSLNSVAVELDTWHGGEAVNDGDGANVSGWDADGGPSRTGTGPWHVGLDVNASIASAQRNHDLGVRDDDLPDIYDPLGTTVRVLYDGGRVQVGLRPRRAPSGPERIVIDREVEPIEVNADRALVGFTAGTGAASCRMEVDRLIVRRAGTAERTFLRGDANADGEINISDGIYVLGYLFLGFSGPPCAEAANANDDGSLDITDGIHILSFLFLGGASPPSPGPPPGACGPDPPGSPVDLGCEEYQPCAEKEEGGGAGPDDPIPLPSDAVPEEPSFSEASSR